MDIKCYLILALLAISGTARSQSEFEKIYSPLLGTWQVNEVRIDTGATRTLLYQNNDFRLMGRLFIIEHDKLMTNVPENVSYIDDQPIASFDLLLRPVAVYRADEYDFPSAPRHGHPLNISLNTPSASPRKQHIF